MELDRIAGKGRHDTVDTFLDEALSSRAGPSRALHLDRDARHDPAASILVHAAPPCVFAS
jgi:hypothetical protein